MSDDERVIRNELSFVRPWRMRWEYRQGKLAGCVHNLGTMKSAHQGLDVCGEFN
jgi:hypothetical protein